MDASLNWRQARRQRMEPSDLLVALRVLEPPVYPGRIARQLGIGLDLDAPIAWSGDVQLVAGEPLISINPDRPPVHRRFTLAHELGHLLLHPLDGVLYRDGEQELADRSRSREAEANRFAAALLMPPWMLQRYIVAGASVDQLADVFQVSVQAMTIQLGFGSRAGGVRNEQRDRRHWRKLRSK